MSLGRPVTLPARCLLDRLILYGEPAQRKLVVHGQELNIRDLSGDRTLVQFGAGDEVTLQSGPNGIRFLLISGAPIQEPVAWHGPIVMNTQAELRQAMAELRNGTFIRPAH